MQTTRRSRRVCWSTAPSRQAVRPWARQRSPSKSRTTALTSMTRSSRSCSARRCPTTFTLETGMEVAVGTIEDDDLPPTLSVTGDSVYEAVGSITFTMSLSGESGLPIDVDWTTGDSATPDPLDRRCRTASTRTTNGQRNAQLRASRNRDRGDDPGGWMTGSTSTTRNSW